MGYKMTIPELQAEIAERNKTIKRLNKRNARDQREIAQLRERIAELKAALYLERTKQRA